MLLTIDVGNTNVCFGILDGDEIVGRYRLRTGTAGTSDEFGLFLNAFMQNSGIEKEQIEDVIISSVVPKLMYSLTSAIIKYIGKQPIIVDYTMKTGITVTSANPSSIGADRIVNTSWAWNTFHSSAIVIDFGTATTFDYVSPEGEFKYVVIMPGLDVSRNALISGTAKLPDVEIVDPGTVLGKTTVEGIQIGLVYGYTGSIEFIVNKMKEELHDPNCRVIATGGLGRVIAEETDAIDEYDPDIAYKGLRILYDLNKA